MQVQARYELALGGGSRKVVCDCIKGHAVVPQSNAAPKSDSVLRLPANSPPGIQPEGAESRHIRFAIKAVQRGAKLQNTPLHGCSRIDANPRPGHPEFVQQRWINVVLKTEGNVESGEWLLSPQHATRGAVERNQ